MARKTESFVIKMDDESEINVTVYELRVGDILKLFDQTSSMQENNESVGVKDLMSLADANFLPLCSNLKIEDLKQMAPSDIKVCLDKFKKVNSAFFEMAHMVGLSTFLKNLQAAALADFGQFVVGLSNAATRMSSTTDTPTSSEPSMKTLD